MDLHSLLSELLCKVIPTNVIGRNPIRIDDDLVGAGIVALVLLVGRYYSLISVNLLVSFAFSTIFRILGAIGNHNILVCVVSVFDV